MKITTHTLCTLHVLGRQSPHLRPLLECVQTNLCPTYYPPQDRETESHFLQPHPPHHHCGRQHGPDPLSEAVSQSAEAEQRRQDRAGQQEQGQGRHARDQEAGGLVGPGQEPGQRGQRHGDGCCGEDIGLVVGKILVFNPAFLWTFTSSANYDDDV